MALLRLRVLTLRLLCREAMHLPAGQAANLFRGQLGRTLKKQKCMAECKDVKLCLRPCPYRRIFSPVSEQGPSGLADPPRPFVLRVAHLDGCTLRPGYEFSFSVHVFDMDAAEAIGRVAASVACSGLGPGRGSAELVALEEKTEEISLDPLGVAPEAIRIRFLTPTQLKGWDGAGPLPFSVLFARARDRVANLSRLYGGSAPEVDYRQLGADAAAVSTTDFRLGRVRVARQSRRTGHRYDLGGLTGTMDVRGDLRTTLPWLQAACWTGVGKQTVWGNGAIALESIRS